MPQYYNNIQPSLKPWKSGTGNSMSVSVVLDQPGDISFTNLDQISGRVVVQCPKELDVDNINVKLEGESRTRLLSPAATGEKQKPQLEYHKILYKVQTVFPSSETARGKQSVGLGKNAQTFPLGTHEFDFMFKLPFNNSCVHEMTKSPSMSVSGSGIEVARAPTRHVKKTLPPTLTGFPGEAEVRYYVKATVTRPFFWKESLRAIVPFNFFPIEPPRPASTETEIYARQLHSFNQLMNGESAKSKMKAVFGRSSEQGTSPANVNGSPTISVDARLPEPAILNCNEDIPLRLLVKKLSNFDGMLYLQSLQVALIGTTKIRAHEAYRDESSDWILMSKSNMGIPIGTSADPVDTENMIDDSLWRGQALPTTVAPTFQTCNIERAYRVDVRVGLSYTDGAQIGAKPQSIVLPLRLDVEVFSGIAPPMELLEAMAEAKASTQPRSNVDTTNPRPQLSDHKGSALSVPPTPIEGGSLEPPAQGSTRSSSSQPPTYVDAPPSYEDAIGTNMRPVDAHRPQYAPVVDGEDDIFRGDEKQRLSRDS